MVPTGMEIDQTISMMVGKTIVKASDVKAGAEAILFLMSDGSAYGFHHPQDCCESVCVEDVCGEIADLIGSPLVQAEEATSEDASTTDPFTGQKCEVSYPDSQTWTFYKFATIKGSVTIRWLGESNGYYSEHVDVVAFGKGDGVPRHFLEAAPLMLTAT
jgi:hypothetical protein